MLSLFLSLALAASATDPATDPKAQPPKPAKPKLICKSETSTRSRMPTRVCKTQEEWDAQAGNVKDELQTKSGGVGG
ncbi:MAG TPA: hypothetical protein PKD99_12875 [Sphingopyxis sp.]|nr:hypothetical protein [Sphingopyxis sp.]HMP45991.1 hypothetical protein [Sphingopyxis sp.]HMQ17692.1 hypothetical protein [Sphingopyxis sp.]